MSTTESSLPDDEQPGTARDAFANRDFRRVFWASFASSTGRWMQNVALGVFAYKLSGTASFTTLVVAAQLFPLLVLSLVGGSLADLVDRRKLLMVTQAWQAAWARSLAWRFSTTRSPRRCCSSPSS
ncbi:MAG: MFS transporter [Acidimicrobiales bacterium]